MRAGMFTQEQYMTIVNEIYSNIYPCSIERTLENRNIFIIGANNRCFPDFVRQGYEAGVSMEAVCQPSMVQILGKELAGNLRIHDWKGRFTISVLDFAEQDMDALVFFSRNPVELSDYNFLQIALEAYMKFHSKIYNYNYNGDIFELYDIEKIVRGIDLYKAINNYLYYYGAEQG